MACGILRDYVIFVRRLVRSRKQIIRTQRRRDRRLATRRDQESEGSAEELARARQQDAYAASTGTLRATN